MCYDIRSISVVILIRTDTTLDLSQKAEKVYLMTAQVMYRKASESKDGI